MTAESMPTAVNSAKQSTRPGPDPQDARDATRLIAIALAAAIPLEALLRAAPWGVNVPLAVGCAAAALVIGVRPRMTGARALLLVTGLVLASVLALRGVSLLWLAIGVALVATAALVALADASWLRDGRPVETTVRVLDVVRRALSGPFWLVGRAFDWSAVMPRERSGLRHVRGIAWSVVVVLPFLLLFASADPVFGALTQDVLDLPRLVSHAILWAVMAWLMIGWLGAVAYPSPRASVVRLSIGAGEAMWVLGGLSALFAAFVAVQVRYFYGGAELVRGVAGLSFAEYARRGFFELVTVAALLLVVLLGVDALTRHVEGRARVTLRTLTVALLGLLGVILVSAIQRMGLYVDQYGLTQDRFFATAFMLWLVVVFGWYCATVLRGRSERFFGGVYVAGIVAVLGLAAIDPIARIATFNVDQAARLGRFDASHLASLGSDAVPALLESFALVLAAERCAVSERLMRWSGDEFPDSGWRSWNYSRARARTLVLSQRSRLTEGCDQPLPGGPVR